MDSRQRSSTGSTLSGQAEQAKGSLKESAANTLGLSESTAAQGRAEQLHGKSEQLAGQAQQEQGPSYLHGMKERMVGGAKETVGKMTGNLEGEVEGSARKEAGRAEQYLSQLNK